MNEGDSQKLQNKMFPTVVTMIKALRKLTAESGTITKVGGDMEPLLTMEETALANARCSGQPRCTNGL